MEDFSKLSDEQLAQIVSGAQQQPYADLASMSDEQLQAIATNTSIKHPVDPGMLERVADMFTGHLRTTPEIERLPDWRGNMPEFSISEGLPALKTALGTMMTGPDETAKIIKSNFPDVQVKQDSKGNYIFKSGIDQREYALKPGFTVSDIPRVIAGAAAFTPAGRATSLLGAGLATGATQAAIEASQAATGGEFNAEDVGVAAGLGVGGELAGRVLGYAIPEAKALLTGKEFIPSSIREAAAQADSLPATEMRDLIVKASGEGIGSSRAQQKLAELAKIDKEAFNAATQLGIDLPPDVFSDNTAIRKTVGSARSITGSEAEAAWRKSVEDTVQKVDNALQNAEAMTPTSEVSDKVKTLLQTTRDDLKLQTKSAYDSVDQSIPADTLVLKTIKPVEQPMVVLSPSELEAKRLNDMILKATGKAPIYEPPAAAAVTQEGPGFPHLKSVLDKTIKDQGGFESLTSQEKSLYKMINEDDVTYGRLIREKNDLRRALRGKNTPYSNLDQSIVEKLYNAISHDQLNAVNQLAGEEVKDRLLGANLLYTKQKQVEKTLVDAFGQDFKNSIVGTMRGAINKGMVGDESVLNKLLSTVPEPLQKEAILSAITSLSRDTSKDFRNQFGVNQFDKVWSTLATQPKIMSRIKQIIGPETYSLLNGIQKVSNYVSRARTDSEVKTGAKLLPLVQEMRAQTFTDHLLGTVGKSVASVLGASVGGPIFAIAGHVLPKFLRQPTDRIAAMARLFNSQPFKDIVYNLATKPVPSTSAIEAFAKSSAFSKLAQVSKLPSDLPSKVRWVKAAMMSQQDMMLPQSAFQQDRVVREVMPNGVAHVDPVTKFKILQRPGGKFRLLSPTGEVSVYDTQSEAEKAATKQLRILTKSPLK